MSENSDTYRAYLRDNFHTDDDKALAGEVSWQDKYFLRITPEFRNKGLGRELALATLDYYCHHTDSTVIPVYEHHTFFDHLGLNKCPNPDHYDLEAAYDFDGSFAALMQTFRAACKSNYATSVTRTCEKLGANTAIADRKLPLIHESRWVISNQHDMFDRPLFLAPSANIAWEKLRDAASADGVNLQAISGFRDWQYQKLLVEKKLDDGKTAAEIFAVNAPPGYSEHHSGCALDIGTEGSEPLSESFEETDAYAWLADNASRFGFSLSYPPNNDLGFVYEPWHWMYQGTATS